MAEAFIGSSGVTVPIPPNYNSKPVKLESRQRTLDGSMLVNYAVTTGDVAVTKYHFELPGIIKSERLAVRAQALKTGNMSYIDHLQIPEVFSTTGSAGSTGTVTINLQRSLGSSQGTTGYISATFNDDAYTVTISTDTAPSSGNVFINLDGTMTIGPECPASTQGIIVNYIPDYSVHIISDDQEFMFKDSSANKISRYRLVLEEV